MSVKLQTYFKHTIAQAGGAVKMKCISIAFPMVKFRFDFSRPILLHFFHTKTLSEMA